MTLDEANELAHADLGYIVVQRAKKLDNTPDVIIPKGAGWGDCIDQQMMNSKRWIIIGKATKKEVRGYVRFIESRIGLKSRVLPGYILIKVAAVMRPRKRFFK